MAHIALGKHKQTLGKRYIEIFKSTAAEVQQVGATINRRRFGWRRACAVMPSCSGVPKSYLSDFVNRYPTPVAAERLPSCVRVLLSLNIQTPTSRSIRAAIWLMVWIARNPRKPIYIRVLFILRVKSTISLPRGTQLAVEVAISNTCSTTSSRFRNCRSKKYSCK